MGAGEGVSQGHPCGAFGQVGMDISIPISIPVSFCQSSSFPCPHQRQLALSPELGTETPQHWGLLAHIGVKAVLEHSQHRGVG